MLPHENSNYCFVCPELTVFDKPSDQKHAAQSLGI